PYLPEIDLDFERSISQTPTISTSSILESIGRCFIGAIPPNPDINTLVFSIKRLFKNQNRDPSLRSGCKKSQVARITQLTAYRCFLSNLAELGRKLLPGT